MQVRHYMTAAAAVTHPDEPVVAAARLMRQRSIGALPVCEDDGTLAGMLTDRDIVVRCISAGDDPQTATVRGIMSRDPVTIEADADVRTAMTAMRAAQVRRLPVTEGGKLAGVLSIDDIARSGKWDMECAQRCAASQRMSAGGEAAHRASDAHPGLLLEEKALIGCGCVPAPPPARMRRFSPSLRPRRHSAAGLFAHLPHCTAHKLRTNAKTRRRKHSNLHNLENHSQKVLYKCGQPCYLNISNNSCY